MRDLERLSGEVSDVVIYLVPLGSGRFELYSEAPADVDVDEEPGRDSGGLWRRLTQRAHARWRAAVQSARESDPDSGLFGRARDRAVCAMSDAIAEQRTLWALRHADAAELVHPSDLTEHGAVAIRDRILNRARTHHLRWLAVDGVLLIVSGVFTLVPGPNVIAYYFAFRVVGHLFSWRGARYAVQTTGWRLRSEAALVELGRLAHLPRAARASRVDEIATDLNLPRLAAFFDRAA